MKKFTFTMICVLLISFNISAQNQLSYSKEMHNFTNSKESNKTQFLGFEIGYAQPILKENSLSYSDTLSNRTVFNGFKVGLSYEANIIKGFGVRFGLNYTFGQAKDKEWTAIGNNVIPRQKLASTIHGLDIPIEWQYKFTIAKQTYIIVYFGPIFQYYLSYKTTRTRQEYIDEDPIVEPAKNHFTEIPVSEQNEKLGYRSYRQFNLLWGLGAGFQYKNFFVRGGYDFGIINHYKDTYYNLGESIGYAPKGRFDQWQVKVGWYILSF